MSFRLIDSGACPAAFNMALDEALAVSVKQGLTPPAVRFYCWDRPSLSLGRFQRKEHFYQGGAGGLDLDFIRKSGLPVVVRPTGGRAVLHGFDELTYSVASRYEGAFKGKDLFGCYALISSAIERALRRLGIPLEVRKDRGGRKKGPSGPLQGPENKRAGRTAPCFGTVSYAEMTANGRKIVGSAQRRWTDGFLQQGSIPFRMDGRLAADVFGGYSNPNFDPAGAGLSVLAPGASPALFKRFLAEEFEGVLGVPLAPSEPDPRELDLARQLLPGYASAFF